MKTCCEIVPCPCSIGSLRVFWNRLACLWRNTLSQLG